MRALDAQRILLQRLALTHVDVEARGYFQVGAGRNAQRALDVFFAFAAEAIDEPDVVEEGTLFVDRFNDGDLLLFESGASSAIPPAERPYWTLSDEPIPEVYEVSFTRQFSFEDLHGEYHGMNTVTFVIQTALVTGLRELRREQIWGTAGPAWTRSELAEHGHDPDADVPTGAAAWRQDVMATPAYREVLADEPALFSIGQSDV